MSIMRLFKTIRKYWILWTKQRAIGEDNRWMRVLWQEDPLGGRCIAVYEDEL